MSNFEFRGRRVTDPKPAVHTPGLNADRYLGTGKFKCFNLPCLRMHQQMIDLYTYIILLCLKKIVFIPVL